MFDEVITKLSRLFPAQAGVIHDKLYTEDWEKTVPRASGGDPHGGETVNSRQNCSPRKRG